MSQDLTSSPAQHSSALAFAASESQSLGGSASSGSSSVPHSERSESSSPLIVEHYCGLRISKLVRY